MRNKLFIIFLTGFVLIQFGCKEKDYAPLETVTKVDLERYAGAWYEIASFPQSFQKGCHCTMATYSKEPGNDYVSVLNFCRKNGVDGPAKLAKAKAYVIEGSNNSKLEVSFGIPFLKGAYYIMELDPNYKWAVVGHPNREALWILSRKKKLPANLYYELLQKIEAKGFDVSKLENTIHDGCF